MRRMRSRSNVQDDPTATLGRAYWQLLPCKCPLPARASCLEAPRPCALVLRNFRRTGARYLLTTTFSDRAENDASSGGAWRPLNLKAHPFGFPEPLRSIVEKCAEVGGAYSDKALGLWEVEAIAAALG
jgi:hypothetical protein